MKQSELPVYDGGLDSLIKVLDHFEKGISVSYLLDQKLGKLHFLRLSLHTFLVSLTGVLLSGGIMKNKETKSSSDSTKQL